jgi:DNA-directed RNA polymerase specialized sigma24 family protein
MPMPSRPSIREPSCRAGRGRCARSSSISRARGARRRGGDATAGVRLEETLVPQPPEEILAVHRALDTLSGLDARIADVVELRYFARLVETEVAETLGVTERTVRRDWEEARPWLGRALG